jgi:hypothetical protein
VAGAHDDEHDGDGCDDGEDLEYVGEHGGEKREFRSEKRELFG